jgi:hypothetical protein
MFEIRALASNVIRGTEGMRGGKTNVQERKPQPGSVSIHDASTTQDG